MPHKKHKFSKKVLRTLIKKVATLKIKSFDIETLHVKTPTGTRNDFLLGGYNDGKKTWHFTDRKMMLQHMIDDREENQIIFATNLGFDANALFWKLIPYKELDIIMRNGQMLSLRYKGLIFSDTGNYSNPALSVEQMGKIIGIHKMSKPKFFGKKPKNLKEWKYLKEYNSKDCIVTRMFMERFQETINKLGANLKLTIASCSMDLYRKNYMPKDIWHEPFDVKDFVFRAYYGGRTEVFSRGQINKSYGKKLDNKVKLYYGDFNSLYPSCMIKAFPKPSSCIQGKNTIYNIQRYEGVSEVSVWCPQMKYPLLPYRNGEKLIFPTGIFRGTYTHLELRKALSLGYEILDIYKQIIYRKTFYPFKKFVNSLYPLRQKLKSEGKYFDQLTVKLLLNSLYGKFATKYMEDLRIYDLKEELKNNSPKVFEKKFLGYTPDIEKNILYCSDTSIADEDYIIPILSVYVTAYGRCKLHNMLTRYDAIYCDTDSVISFKKILDSKELGELKLEHIITGGYLVKPKFYMIQTRKDNIMRVKGVRRLTLKDFYRLLSGKPVIQERFMKLKGALRLHLEPNEIISFPKALSLEDDKRKWHKPFDKDGWQDSEPIMLNTSEHSTDAGMEDDSI